MKQQRHRPEDAVLAGAQRLRRDVLRLAGLLVEADDAAAVDDVRVQRIRRDVGVLVGADTHPVAERDLPAVAAARDPDRTALLLSAVDPVRKLLVGRHVIQLRRRLVVPGDQVRPPLTVIVAP